MISAAIVEDEPWVRRLIISEIPWDRFDMELVAELDNGPEACEACLSMKPDIVFADIRVPGLDGLSLIEQLRPKLPHTHFLIITGHADFHYAQEAVRLGVTDYLLKPVRSRDITAILERVCTEIRNARSNRRRIKRIRRENETLHAALRSQTEIAKEQREIGDPRINKALMIIRERVTEQISLEEIASSVGMSRSSFSAHFRHETGQSYVDFLSGFRVQMARELLQRPELSIAEIGAMVGYADPNYFARVFKARYSVTPNEFRRSHFHPHRHTPSGNDHIVE